MVEPNHWLVRTPGVTGPFPETSPPGAAQPGRWASRKMRERTVTKIRFIVFLCSVLLATASSGALAVKPEYRTELNRLLVAVSKKEPLLFGADPVCQKSNEFWEEVLKTSLLAALEKEEGISEHLLGPTHTVWFVPVSPCFSGNRPGFLMVVRDGKQYKEVETQISGTVENVRLEGNKILFNLTSYAGLSDEYHYACTYDGKQLTEVLLKHIER